MAKYKIIPSSRTIVQSPISIGHKAEKGVEAIEFDLTAWVETYGSGTLTVIMRRWGDAIPYPIALEIDENNKATWVLSDTDTARAGMAYAQLSYIVGETVVKKSDIYTFRVMDSLTGEGEPPEAYESWLESLTHLAAEAMAEVLDIKGIATDKTLTVDGGIADGKATGDALALKADASTTYTKTEVDQMIKDVEVETDTTLSVSGAPADAKATGDALSALEDQFSEETDQLKADLGNISDATKNLWTNGNLNFLKLLDTGTTLNISAGTYTMSAVITTDSANTSSRFVVYTEGGTSQSVAINANRGDVRSYASFTADTKINRIVFYASTVSGSDGITAQWVNPQIESGSSATEYVQPFIAYDKVARENVSQVLEFVGTSRNFWILGDAENFSVYDTKVGGVDYPAGNYTFSCMMDTQATNSRVYFYFDDSTNAFITFSTATYRQARPIVFPSKCNRIVIYSGINVATSTGNVANYRDIQLEHNNCYGYQQSTSENWGLVAYPTPYIVPKTSHDYIAEQMAASYWKGKTANFVGDSVTQGIDYVQRIGYVPVVQSILQFGRINNYAIGGTRLAHVEGEADCLIDRYTDMTADCDLFYFMANTNDYASQVPIGAVDSTDISTYNGALNVLFTWLKSTYLTQPIIISTMLTRKVNYSGGQPLPVTIDQYAQAVRDRCAEYGFILYDAYKLSGLDLLNSPTDGTGITDDGLHPNRTGAIALGRKVAAFINAQ